MATNFYKIGGSYYRSDTGAKVLTKEDLQALAKAGGKEVQPPSTASTKPAATTSPPPTAPVTTVVPTVRKATLYGPSGSSPVVVDVGSSQAAQLQSQGWGLTPGSYRPPVTPQTQPKTNTQSPTTSSIGTQQNQQVQNNSLPQGSAFTGEHLVRFSSMPGEATEGNTSTVFLVDANHKSLRPFMSMDALVNYFTSKGINPQAALSAVSTISPQELEPSGSLSNFAVLDHNYGVQPDGKVSNADFSPASVRNLYGKTQNDAATKVAVDYLKAIRVQMNGMVSDGTVRGFTRQNLDSVFNDPGQLARLINAMAYGNYDAKDISMELSRLAQVNAGNASLANVSVINDNQTKDAYAQTSNYKLATQTPGIALPQNAAERIMQQTTDSNYFKNPEGALVDMMKDPDFKNKLDQMKSAYADILNQGLLVKTDNDRQIAQNNWDNFRKAIQENLGITLAASATDAWDQIANLDKQAAGQGMMDSGVHDEMVDNYLKKVRASDQAQRVSKIRDEEKQKSAFYTSSASPAQIQQLIDEDKASGLPRDQWQSVRWGLLPSDDVKSKFSVDTLYNQLKTDYSDKNYPDWYLQQKAQQLHDAALDENGNMRSSIYQNYITSKQANNESSFQNKAQNIFKQAVNTNDQFFKNFQEPSKDSTDYFSGTTSKDREAALNSGSQTQQSGTSSLTAASDAAKNIANNLSGSSSSSSSSSGSQGSTQQSPTTQKWGDNLKLSSGQTISFSDPNYSTFASQLGIKK